MWKYNWAPHANITSVSPSGMNVQSNSSVIDPWIGCPTSSGCFRLYFSANTTTSAATSTVKNTVTEIRNRYSMSTSCETDDALGGQKGRLLNIYRTPVEDERPAPAAAA